MSRFPYFATFLQPVKRVCEVRLCLKPPGKLPQDFLGTSYFALMNVRFDLLVVASIHVVVKFMASLNLIHYRQESAETQEIAFGRLTVTGVTTALVCRTRLAQLACKSAIHVIYMRLWLTVNGALVWFVKGGDS